MLQSPYFLFLCLNLFLITEASIPIEILCANPACTEPISEAQGLVTYASSSRNVLNFKPGHKFTIVSKSKNKNDYWGAIINGRSGYVPANLIKEIRVFHKFEDLIPISVEALSKNSVDLKSSSSSNLLEINFTSNNNLSNDLKQKDTSVELPEVTNASGKISDPTESATKIEESNEKLLMEKPNEPHSDTSTNNYNVIEGTTVYANGDDQITPSTTSLAQETSPTTMPAMSQIDTKQFEDLIPISVEALSKNSTDLKSSSSNLLEINVTSNDNSYDDLKQKDSSIELPEDTKVSDPTGSVTKVEEGKEKLPTEKPMRNLISADVQNANMEKGSEILSSSNDLMVENNGDSEKKGEESKDKTEKSALESKENDKKEKSNTHDEEVLIDLKNNIFPESTTKLSIVSNSNEIKEESHHVFNEEITPENSLQNTQNTSIGDENIEKDKTNKILSGEMYHLPEVKETIVALPEKTNMEISNTMLASAMNNEHDISSKANRNDLSMSSSQIPNSDLIQQYTASESLAPEVVSTKSEQLISEEDSRKHSEKIYNKIEEKTTKIESNDVNQKQVDSNVRREPQNIISDVSPGKIEMTLQKESSNFQYSTHKPDVQPIQVLEKPTDGRKESLPTSNTIFEGLVSASEKVENDLKKLSPSSDTMYQVEESVAGSSDDKQETSDIFSRAVEFFSGWLGKTEESTNEKVFTDSIEVENNLGELQEKTKTIEPDENGTSNEAYWMFSGNPFFFLNSSFFNDSGVSINSNTCFYLIVTAVTVLFFTLGHNLIEKKGKTGVLIAKINKLEQELLITSKENFILKDEVQSANDKINLYENSANDELILTLQAELEESKKARAELESSNEILQQELDAATEAGLDLNKMLSEVLTQKGGSESLLESVENLQAQLNSQQKIIDEMTKKLGVKNEENEALQIALDSANEKIESLKEELDEVKQNLVIYLKEKEDLTEDFNSQISQFQIKIKQLEDIKDKESSKSKKNFEELHKKYSEMTRALAVKEEEFKSLKESIKNLKSKGNVNLENVFDVSRVKGELAVLEKDNENLRETLKEEENSKRKLEDQVNSMNVEVEHLKKSIAEADLKKIEAEKKLDVLSGYFKEKETQLQKELGLQEALWAQKKGDEKAVYNMMKSLQEEVESYKSQNETLKKEILDQERGLKNQIAILEQKAHENWVAARQAERRLEENKQETAQLRNRLTLIEKSSNGAEGKANHRSAEELNGEPTSPVLHNTASPLMFPPLPLDPNNSSLLPPGFMPHPMFMPPPVAGFIPPPPFLPGDRRPPPLGRMSSPPLNSRFSPSSPADYPFERMPSPPLSPLTRNYRSLNEADREHFRHRTPPFPPLHHRNWDDSNEIPGFIPISSQRDSTREPKGSNISSGHSSSDSLDKSSRHSGRV